jgi:hypothetical protein
MKHRAQRLCLGCGERPPRFRSRAKHSDGRVRQDKDHTLCQQCHRAEVNRARNAPASSETASASGEGLASVPRSWIAA